MNTNKNKRGARRKFNALVRFFYAFLFDDTKTLISPCGMLFVVCLSMGLGIVIGLGL